MNQETTRQAVAEAIGTFMLVLVGAGSVVVSPPSLGALGPALAHGLILVVIAATYGHISGAHVNPAVSLAMWIGNHLDTRRLGIYMLAQLIGGLVACVILRIVLPVPGSLGQTTAAADVNELDIILVEGILTFFLVSTIYQTAVYGKGGHAAPLFIGLTLGAAFLFGGPLTGASLNPVRTLAPALLAEDRQDFVEVLIYLVAIFGGGALAGILHMDTFKVAEEAEGGRRARKKI